MNQRCRPNPNWLPGSPVSKPLSRPGQSAIRGRTIIQTQEALEALEAYEDALSQGLDERAEGAQRPLIVQWAKSQAPAQPRQLIHHCPDRFESA